MSKRTISFIIAFVLGSIFLILTVFSSESMFNFIPYLLHESISPGGAGETNFIIGFDIVISVLVFYIAYKVANLVLTRKQV